MLQQLERDVLSKKSSLGGDQQQDLLQEILAIQAFFDLLRGNPNRSLKRFKEIVPYISEDSLFYQVKIRWIKDVLLRGQGYRGA